MVPLAKNQGLCIGVMSYDGQVNFGLIGDYDGMRILEDVTRELRGVDRRVDRPYRGRRSIFRRFIPGRETPMSHIRTVTAASARSPRPARTPARRRR